MASKPTRDAGPRYSRLINPVSCEAIVLDRIGRGASDVYTVVEAGSLRDWLNDRDAGYPSLRRFEGADESRYDDVPKWDLPRYMRSASEPEYRSRA